MAQALLVGEIFINKNLPDNIKILKVMYQKELFKDNFDIHCVDFKLGVEAIKGKLSEVIMSRWGGRNAYGDEFNTYVMGIIDEGKQHYDNLQKGKLRACASLLDDERSCFFIWCSLRIRAKSESGKISFNFGSVLSHDDRVEQIEFLLFFFDFIEGCSSKSDGGWFESIISRWMIVSKRKINVGFLDCDDSEQCDWAWDYVCNAFLKEELSCEGFFLQTPFTHKEKYIFLLGVLDSCSLHSEDKVDEMIKKDIVSKCSRAWSQKKYRDSKEGMVPINFYISKEARETLKSLARKKSVPMEVALDELILGVGKEIV